MREVLRHKSVEKVVMVDIDEVVTSFCRTHLEANTAAFEDPRLDLVHDDARAQLERWPGTFDVIIGDLADPVEGGPCYQVTNAPLRSLFLPSASTSQTSCWLPTSLG